MRVTQIASYAIAAATLFLAGGCADETRVPFARFWQGEFQGASGDPKTPMRKEWVYKGWLQVYITGNKYKMHMESIGQILDISGTWTHKADRMLLTATNIDFDDRGGEMMLKPGVKPIAPDLVRDAYSRPLVLVLQPDKQTLVGLEMSIGPIVGKHLFRKGGE